MRSEEFKNSAARSRRVFGLEMHQKLPVGRAAMAAHLHLEHGTVVTGMTHEQMKTHHDGEHAHVAGDPTIAAESGAGWHFHDPHGG